MFQENPNKTKSENVKDSNLSAQEYILKYMDYFKRIGFIKY